MTGRCDGCAKFTNTLKYEYYCSDKCYLKVEEQYNYEETPMTDNEKVRLQVVIDQKNAIIADAEKRVDIYKEAWRDAEKDNTHLRQKLDEVHQLAMTRLNDNMGLAQENAKLREELQKVKNDYEALHKDYQATIGQQFSYELQINSCNLRMKRYQEEILDIEKHNEELFAALNNVRNIITRAADGIEGLIRVD